MTSLTHPSLPFVAALVLLSACASGHVSGGTADAEPSRTDAARSDASLADVYGSSALSTAHDAGAAQREADGGSIAPDAGAPATPLAFVTTSDLTSALSSTPVMIDPSGRPDVTVRVDPSTVYQSMVGFGASISDSSSYVMSTYLKDNVLDDVLAKLFDPDAGIGLSFLRQPIGASDFSSVGNFSYDDQSADSSLAHFSVAQDQKATLPLLRRALAISSQIFVLGTPWSAPAWMKLNASMDGSGGAPGNPGLASSAYDPFARYLVEFVQAYSDAGVTVGALTPQNEPLNDTASYPGMSMTAPYEAQLIGENLGPALHAAGLATEVWAYDHNWDHEEYPAQVMADSAAGAFSEGAAFHCYAGDPSAMTTFHQAYPDKSLYMTECSGGDWQTDPFAATVDLLIDSTSNWARAVSLWNVALDEHKGPQNHGCSTCRGVITVNSDSGAVTYNADYYALGHFSKFVRPGAERVGSSSTSGQLKQVAFRQGDGRYALIARNTSAKPLSMQVQNGSATLGLQIPAGAAVTLAWSTP